MFKNKLGENTKKVIEESKECDDRIMKLEQKMLELVEIQAENGFDESKFENEYREISSKIKQLKQAKNDLQKTTRVNVNIEEVMGKMGDVSTKLYDYDERLLKSTVSEITVHKNMSITVKLKVGLEIKKSVE